MSEVILTESSPIVLQMYLTFEMTHEEFFNVCQLNQDYRIERRHWRDDHYVSYGFENVQS